MAKNQNHKTATSLPTCVSCKRDVGVEAGCVPFNVDDHASLAGDHHECFCPTCFVYVRSPREPDRWRPGCFVPIKCGGCGLESVAIGQDSCLQCGSRSVVILLPKLGVV